MKVDPVKQPSKCHSLVAGNVSNRRISAFDNHLDDLFIVLKDVLQGCMARLFGVRRDSIDAFYDVFFRRLTCLLRSIFG